MIKSSDFENASWQCIHFALPEQTSDVKESLKSSTLKVIDCDVSPIKNDSDLFTVVSEALNFPDYFGSNWDAMDECLSDMEWLSASGCVLFFSSAGEIWKDAPYTAGKFVSACQTAAEQWAKEQVPFHLVFVL